MITKFINRKVELDFLSKMHKNKGFDFIPIYGRRRIGKTELILNFIREKKSIYFLATSGTKKENINKFKAAAEHIVDLGLVMEDWEDIFKYIKNNTKDRLIIIIDEFTYLLDTEAGLSSIFQRILDLHLKESNIFLVLCGSSLGMMYKEVLSYRAPLYGRRTGQLEIKPLRFKEAIEFFDKPFEECVEIYSICGGVPAYLKEFVEKKPLFELMIDNILLRGSLLREEIPFLLREEFRDPRVYLSILSSLSLGHRKLGNIINYCGFKDKTSITPYLHNLENLGYIRRELPITEKPRSKKGLYLINDWFFKFWFRMVRNNFDIIERDTKQAIKKIKGEFNTYVSLAFEEICGQFIEETGIIESNRIGKWWYKDKEIDIVAINEETKDILFCECKWQKDVDSEKIFHELKEKANFVKWYNEERREHFAIFAKSFKTQKVKGVKLFNLKDLEEVFNNKNK